MTTPVGRARNGLHRHRRLALLVVSGLVVIVLALLLIRRGDAVPHKAWQAYQQGTDHARARRYAEATEAFAAAIRAYPSYVDAYFQMGNVYLAIGQNLQAIAALGRAADLNPHYPHIYCQLAEAHVREHDETVAKLHLDAALALDPHCPHAQFLMSEYYRRKEDYRQCERHLKRALALEPNVAIMWRTLAGVYFDLSQLDAAESALTKAVVLQPDEPSAHYLIGMLWRRRPPTPQNLERSYNAFQEAARLRAEDPQQQANCYFEIAKIEEARGNDTEAMRLYQRVLSLDPSRRQAHYQLAQLCVRQGRPKQAETHLKEFERLEATWRHINHLRNQIDQAVTERERTDAFLALAKVYADQGETGKAVSLLREVLWEQPRHREAIARLAQILNFSGEGHGSH